MKDCVGIIISFAYFFGLLIVSQHIPLKTLEGKRKFVHIMLGNWWLIVLTFFSNVFAALIVPVSFIFINYWSLKRNKDNGLLSSLERKNQKSYGIVLYPIAMSMMVWLSFVILHDKRIGGVGLMALSYGDGMAALIGKKFNYKVFKIWGNTKSISGCMGMLISTIGANMVYMYLTSLVPNDSFIWIVFLVALVSTVAEAITPFGIDDITVPFSAIAVYILLTNGILIR